jgi:uncharacterized membrane protein
MDIPYNVGFLKFESKSDIPRNLQGLFKVRWLVTRNKKMKKMPYISHIGVMHFCVVVAL